MVVDSDSFNNMKLEFPEIYPRLVFMNKLLCTL